MVHCYVSFMNHSSAWDLSPRSYQRLKVKVKYELARVFHGIHRGTAYSAIDVFGCIL